MPPFPSPTLLFLLLLPREADGLLQRPRLPLHSSPPRFSRRETRSAVLGIIFRQNDAAVAGGTAAATAAASSSFSSPSSPSPPLSLLRRTSSRSMMGLLRCRKEGGNAGGRVIEIRSSDPVQVGDTVSLEYLIRGESGEELQSSKNTGPMTFEVGVGQTVRNPLFQGIDSQVIGLRIGEGRNINMTGPAWNPELLFKVPIDHPEIERLQRRYSAQGGLQEGEYVELINGNTALVMRKKEDEVVLDCNSAFAGNSCLIEFEVVNVEAGDGTPKAYRPPIKV